MGSENLTTVLNSFISIMKTQLNENSSDSWICRFDCINFSNYSEYPGIVERIFSDNVAVIAVAKFNDKEVWENQQKDLARAVFFGNASPFHDTQNSVISHFEKEALKEGDMVTVRVGLCDRKKGSIFNYYVTSINKVGRKVEEEILSKIRDPLRGIVEKLISQNEGIIKFQAYSGNTLRATFLRENLYRQGLRVKESPISALVQENSQVHLELSEWDTEEKEESVEGKLDAEKIMLKASSVWLKGDQRPREDSDTVEEAPREDGISNEFGKEMGGSCDFTNGSISDGGKLRGELISLEQDWGLVAVEEQVYVFYSSAVYLFGLKVEHLPLNKIFCPGQIVRLCLEEETVTSLTFGSSLTSSLRKQTISLYCHHHSISDAIKNSLEDLNRMQSQDDS